MRIIKVQCAQSQMAEVLQGIHGVLPAGASILSPQSSMHDHGPEEADEEAPPSSKPAPERRKR